MAAYWLVFVPRGKLRWSAPWWLSLFPVIYFVYVLARGQLDHRYPYPFIDVGKLGWLQVGLNAAGIAFGFVSPGSRWCGSTAGVHLGQTAAAAKAADA